jgi:hypothetical protein
MRVTFTMAATAESTHIVTVSANRPAVIAGVITTGSAVSAVARTTMKPTIAAMQNPMAALSSACRMMTLWM